VGTAGGGSHTKVWLHPLAPFYPRGLILLGEAGKWVAASPRRFEALTVHSTEPVGVAAVSLRGAPHETVRLALLRPGSCAHLEAPPAVLRLDVVLDAQGCANAIFRRRVYLISLFCHAQSQA
jgi:hypothetical protein